MTTSDWIEVAKILRWPVAVVVIAVIALFFFRRSIIALIDRTGRVEIPNRLLLEAPVSGERSPDIAKIVTLTPVTTIDWKPANLFYLVRLIEWAKWIIGYSLIEKQAWMIKYGLDEAMWHAGELKLSSTIIGRIKNVRDSLEGREEGPFDKSWCAHQANELSEVGIMIGELVKASQPDFKYEPVDKQDSPA